MMVLFLQLLRGIYERRLLAVHPGKKIDSHSGGNVRQSYGYARLRCPRKDTMARIWAVAAVYLMDSPPLNIASRRFVP